MEIDVIDDVKPETRSAYKRKTAELDEMASGGGMLCGIPAAMIACPELVEMSPSFLKSLVEGLGGEIPEFEIPTPKEITDDDWVFHTSWSLRRPWRGQFGIVEIWRNKVTGKFEKEFYQTIPWQSALSFTLMTVAHSTLFGIEEAEIKAQEELIAMLNSRQRRQWLLCNSFYEKGLSGIVYWLRKNRPTIALRSDPDTAKDGKATPLCALCLHPIGWYKDSFAGMMAPSDDVLAHLLMIRANEHLFWKRSNQHPLHIPNAGIC